MRGIDAMSGTLLTITLLALFAGTTPLQAADPRLELGKQVFEEHCASCHAKGGNRWNRDKTLSKKDMAANNVRTVEDVIGLIRKSGPLMPIFGPVRITSEEADAVAYYVLETFNK
jgi:cytochrome c6